MTESHPPKPRSRSLRGFYVAMGLVALLLVASALAYRPLRLRYHSWQYKKNRNHGSLQVLTERLRKGMHRREVMALLGEPDYSPTQGQYYYSSDEEKVVYPGVPSFTVTLVVNYNPDGRLVDYSLGPVGE